MIAVLVLAALEMQVLTLREAERRAETHHPSLSIGNQLAVAAAARETQSLAALLPQVEATASYRHSTANRTIRIGTPAVFAALRPPPSPSTFDYLNTGVTATQLLFDFGQSREAWRAARLLAESATFDARALHLAIVLEVRLAFFAARARRELVDVAREDLTNQRRHVEQVQGLVDVKLRPPIDLLQARANVGSSELRLIAAENEYALARADLDRAMGATAALDYEVASDELPAVTGEEGPADALFVQASHARPEVSSNQRQIEAGERGLASVRGRYGPTFHLSLSATDSGPMFDRGPFEWRNLRWNYGAALVFTWRFFEGGRTVGQIREAEAVLAQARSRRLLLDIDLRVEVERARRNVGAAKAAATVAATTVEIARERLRLADGRYKAGVGTALEVSDAQLGHVNASAQHVQARYNLAAARAQLLAALGQDAGDLRSEATQRTGP
ncbi:MAG TPA: TolC family protein [Polyangia bacterium]|nr:TolC family protein [Polyangia bacterium]